MTHGFLIGWAAAGIVVSAAGSALAQTPAPAAQPAIDLKLMEREEGDRSRGCTVTLWQADRDPDRDRYAIVFIEQLTGANHARQPARIKVGDRILPMVRIATGGRTNGYGLYEHQLYQIQGGDDVVVLSLWLGPLEGEAVSVDGGQMTVVMRGRMVARVSVKGGAGCMGAPIAAAAQAPPRPAPAPAPSAPAGPPLHRYSVEARAVPAALRAAARRQFQCEDRVMATGVVGFGLSEEAAIWMIPCQTYAYQANAVFAHVQTASPGNSFRFLTFSGPRGRERTTGPHELTSPSWDVRTRTVTGIGLGRASGDCGVLERHVVTPTGDFRLVEYREKERCDGRAVPPEQFPLVFRAN